MKTIRRPIHYAYMRRDGEEGGNERQQTHSSARAGRVWTPKNQASVDTADSGGLDPLGSVFGFFSGGTGDDCSGCPCPSTL